MAVTYTRELLEQMYAADHPALGPVYGPTRAFYQAMSTNAEMRWWENLRARRLPPGIAKEARLLVVGCGFGFLVEKLIEAGFENVWGIDSADYYFTEPRASENFDPAVRLLVQQMDVRTMDRSALTGSTTEFDAIITESVLEGYAPEEQDAILASCEAQRAARNRPVVHIVYDGVDMGGLGGCPPRTMDEWEASTARRNHNFVSAHGIAGG